MVKNKIATTLLTIAAIAIWCIVGYRIFRWISPKETPVANIASPKVESGRQPEDSLMLDYRDPFLGSVKEVKSTVNSYVSEPVPEPAMPSVAYKGLIRDGDGIVKAMIAHEGRLEGFTKGAVIDGLRLTDITAEYIVVKWRGTEYIITAK